MSEKFTIKIPRTSDRTVAQTFRKLATKYKVSGGSGRAAGGVQLEGIPLENATSASWESLLKQNSALLDYAQVSIGGSTITYYRGGTSDPKSPIYDEVQVSHSPNVGGVTNEERLSIAAFLCKELKAFDPERTPGNAVTAEAKQLEALHQSTLDRLEQLAEDIIRRTTETQSRLDEEYADKKRKVEEELAQKRAALEEEYAAEQARLIVREDALNAKLQEIDNRGNTHARREIRNRMLDDVKARIEKFGVSEATARKRIPVFRGIMALLGTLCLVIVFTMFEIETFHRRASSYSVAVDRVPSVVKEVAKAGSDSSSTAPAPPAAVAQDQKSDRTELYLLWVRLTILTLGLVGTALYYIRWQNRWAEQHSSSEFQLQQFYIDVNRANWIIESGLEWRKETASEIPDIVLTSVTKNLFNSQNEPPPALHPADELASALLGSASKLKLNAGDSVLEFDKPGKITSKK